MIKVAVLYICTGKYNQFFADFYTSCEQYFLNGVAQVEYFVFTDNMHLSAEREVHLYERKCQGFPMDSLFRFDMFLSIENELKTFDYCFFFNSNMKFVSPVNKDFLPVEDDLAAVVHPGFYKQWSCLFPYERNKKSTAYIEPYCLSYRYYMGSLNGGKTDAFLKLAKQCSINTHKDYECGIVAKVHDESHLNCYIHKHGCKGLSPAYAYPEGWKLPFDAKILLRDKVKVDTYFNKGRKFTPMARIKKGCGIVWDIVRWYLRF